MSTNFQNSFEMNFRMVPTYCKKFDDVGDQNDEICHQYSKIVPNILRCQHPSPTSMYPLGTFVGNGAFGVGLKITQIEIEFGLVLGTESVKV